MGRKHKRKPKGKHDRDDAKPRLTQREQPGSSARYFVPILMPVMVALLGFSVFYPALDAEFVDYDDDRLFVSNTSYRGFETEHIQWMFSTTFMGHYQPLTWLSSALDYKISGTDPVSYHRNNLILHSLNGLLLYFVAMRLLAAAAGISSRDHPIALRIASAAAALLFAVHPLRVESVAWASERRDVLSVFFLLLALLSYLRAFPPGEEAGRSRGWCIGSWVLLALSLLCKAWGMSFVVLVTILDLYPLRRLPLNVSVWGKPERRQVLFQKLPYLALGLAAAITAGFAQRSALNTMKSLEEWGIVERVVQAFYGLAFYAWKTVWPTRLAPGYELPHSLDPFRLHYVLPFAAVVAGGIAVILLRRRCPGLAAASTIYVLTLAPVLGLAQSGPQFVADRYSYVSCIGWALLAGGGLLLIWRRRPWRGWHVGSGIAMVLVIAVLAVGTWRQTALWRDSKTLWGHVITLGLPSPTAHLNYGILLRREGLVEEGIGHYRKAIELKPDSGNAWFALGNALKQKKDYRQAEEAYREAVQFMTQKNKGYLNLGNMYYNNLNRVDDAIEAYRAAVEHVEAFPSKMFSPTPYLALGIALRDKGNVEGARRMLEVARKYRQTRERAESELARLGHRK